MLSLLLNSIFIDPLNTVSETQSVQVSGYFLPPFATVLNIVCPNEVGIHGRKRTISIYNLQCICFMDCKLILHMNLYAQAWKLKNELVKGLHVSNWKIFQEWGEAKKKQKKTSFLNLKNQPWLDDPPILNRCDWIIKKGVLTSSSPTRAPRGCEKIRYITFLPWP